MKLKVPLQGERLTLRNYDPADLAFHTQMWFDEENGKADIGSCIYKI